MQLAQQVGYFLCPFSHPVFSKPPREPWCIRKICLASWLPVEVWSFVFLKFALHLHKWSCWDQISLVRQDPVVLSQVGERTPAKLWTTKWLWTGTLGASLCPHTTTCPFIFSSHLLSIVSCPFLLYHILFSPLLPSFFFIFLSPFFSTYLFFLFISFSFPFIFPLPLLSFCSPPPDHFLLAIAQCLITAQRTFAANCWWLYKRLSGTF